MNRTVDNGQLRLTVKDFGAEVGSLVDLATGKELIWNGDAKWWPRQAPICFPICGELRDRKYTFLGKEYSLDCHGFARDTEFAFVGVEENTIRHRLVDTEATRQRYPFSFCLEVSHSLQGRSLKTEWKVVNTDEKDLPFSIGGHTAFLCPLDNPGMENGHAGCYLVFEGKEALTYRKKSAAQTLLPDHRVMNTDQARVRLTPDFFASDLYLFEDQTSSIGLADSRGHEYITVHFPGFPDVVVWAKPNAPFVCIEPWFGLPDADDFEGTIMDKKGMIILKPSETFATSYTIDVKAK